MIKTEKVVALLRRQIEKLEKLSGEELGGYAIIISPDQPEVPLEVLLLDNYSDERSFLELVKGKLVTAKIMTEKDQFGAVGTGGAPWRK